MSALAGIDIALWDLKGMIEHLLLSGGGFPLSPPLLSQLPSLSDAPSSR